jgi:O-glycosyl hydrolase
MEMRKTTAYLLLMISALSNSAICQNTVTIDTTARHQTIFGWGAGLRRATKVFYDSSPTLVSQVEDLCFNQLHVNIVRALCQATMEPVNDNSDPFSLDTSKLVWTYYDYATKDIYAIQRALAVSKGRINYVFSSNNSAPPWQKTNNSITYGGTVLPTMYDEFTEYLSAYLLGMQNRYHIRINGFSLFNEPGDSVYFETLSSPPSQVKDLVVKMRKRLNSLEQSSQLPHIDIIAPESPEVSNTNVPADVGKNCIFYLDPAQGGMFADTAAFNSVDIVGTHDYFDEDNTANWAKLRSISKNKPIWVTEVCTSSFLPYDITSKNAVVQAKWIHRSFTIGDVSAFAMYAFYDTLPAAGNIGALVIYNGNSVIVPKRYYGFKQFVNFVRPGYFRVGATSSNKNLFVSSYLNPARDTLVVVAINDTNIVLSNVTFRCPPSPFPVIQYATCDDPDYNTTQLENIPAPVSGNFVADMQAMSIKTFVVSLGRQTGISGELNAHLESCRLSQNYPNPFNPSTTIGYSLPSPAVVSLRIYNTLGQEVALLVTERKDAGNYQATWNAAGIPSGMYFSRLSVEGFVETKKMLLLK